MTGATNTQLWQMWRIIWFLSSKQQQQQAQLCFLLLVSVKVLLACITELRPAISWSEATVNSQKLYNIVWFGLSCVEPQYLSYWSREISPQYGPYLSGTLVYSRCNFKMSNSKIEVQGQCPWDRGTRTTLTAHIYVIIYDNICDIYVIISTVRCSIPHPAQRSNPIQPIHL